MTPAPDLPAPDRRPRTPRDVLLRDGATISGVALVVSGFVALGLGWRGVAATLDPQVQVSFLVSGGVAGVVLVGLACGLAVIQADRFVDALVDRAWARLAREVTRLGADVAERAVQPAASSEDTVELPRRVQGT